MAVTTPFWFKQRQGTLTDVGPGMVRVSGPNLKEAVLGIRRGEGGWSAFMRLTSDGPDVVATPSEIDTPYAAWEAAFEIYRKSVVI